MRCLICKKQHYRQEYGAAVPDYVCDRCLMPEIKILGDIYCDLVGTKVQSAPKCQKCQYMRPLGEQP